MTKANLFSYAEKKWKSHKETITIISKDNLGQSLVFSDKQIYHFDKKIIPTIFENKDVFPSAADGINILKNEINIIEFKKGFKQKITKNNFNEELGRCKKIEPPALCKDYWDLFWKNKEKEKNELLDSLKLKAIETYITLEKHIFPYCENKAKKININFIAVIDGDEVDETEDILEDLSTNPSETTNNIFKTIKNSLLRLKNSPIKEYYYDNIKVFSSTMFQEEINNW